MDYSSSKLSKAIQLSLYQKMLLPRLIEQKMLLLLRKGKLSKWFSGIGQEAISVGATMALHSDEYIMPLHRNLGVFTSREIPLWRLFAQWQGKITGFTKGRDRSFHFGTNEYHIAGMISHLGPQLSLAAGVALSHQLKKEGKVSLAFSGEGGTSQGEFHEALNTAAVWKLPVIFIIENNGYGLSTPSNEQYACKKLSDRALGYGMQGLTIDGNNVLEVYETVNKYANEMRANPFYGPVLIECNTFRMRGHEEASGVKYVPKELFEEWAKKDPIQNFEQYLLSEKWINQKKIDELTADFNQQINEGLDKSAQEENPKGDTQIELNDVYQPYVPIQTENNKGFNLAPIKQTTKEMRLVDAISNALHQAMQKHDNLIIMGQDVAEYGGVFKITEGFVEEFGKERVRNTTLCESAILGIGLGLSLGKMKAVVEMQFADFVSCGFNQIVNNLAKIHYRWQQNADVVVRMPTGAGVGAGPFHSQSNEAWFTHTPGLKVIYPSNPQDAKGLLLSAIEDPNPIMFFEHKALYRSLNGDVNEDYFTIPIGKAKLVSKGEDISIITYGMGVSWAMEAAKNNPDISLNILDLRTLLPWDESAVIEAVMATGKVIVLHEDTLTGGIGADIASYIAEQCFEHLDAPVFRVASLDTPVPFAQVLEQNFLAVNRLQEKIEALYNY